MARAFQARFPGRCGRCDNPITVGDHVHYDDDELVHTDCDTDTLPDSTGTACPNCWLVHAGACW
ncbi:hypothetical protein C1Y40_04132 [Mycobacterium talmoniae]|uniref:Uncharacterized protein n=1 Tax=Mycobacterium talmoniae TaxID=1858794 RepID=A0A2S8BGD6_9MYCO|nr:hypothetical protein C1Y40_04132 [Mycobacterium talmoniae]